MPKRKQPPLFAESVDAVDDLVTTTTSSNGDFHFNSELLPFTIASVSRE